jgi:hypothetical protein
MERICLLAGSQTVNTTDKVIVILRLQLVNLFHSALSFASMHVTHTHTHTHTPGGAKKMFKQ